MIHRYKSITLEDSFDYIKSFLRHYNSYIGFLKYHRTYNMRRRLWRYIPASLKIWIYPDNNFSVAKVNMKYKKLNNYD